MAYSNYGAFVYCNGERREDKEDCPLFEEQEPQSYSDLCHGAMGDGNIRVRCYKQYPPEIYEHQPNGLIIEVPCCDEDNLEYDKDIVFEYKGYKFEFIPGKPCSAKMVEPNGTKWECTYGYAYGAGWSD